METNDVDFEALRAAYQANLPKVAGVLTAGLSARSAKVKQLVLGGEGVKYSLKNTVAVYTSSEPLFIREVRFYGPDIVALCRAIELSAVRFDGKKLKSSQPVALPKAAFARVRLGQIVDSFEISALKRVTADITRIEVVGYTIGQVEAAGDQMREALEQRIRLDEYVAELTASVAARKEEREGLEEAIEALTGQSLELQQEKVKLDFDVGVGAKAVAESKSSLEKLLAENGSAAASREQLTAELARLNSTIGDKRVELRDLVEEKRMISDEFSDFVVEGKGQAQVYVWISVVPALTVATAVGFLLWGGWNIAHLEVSTPQEAYALFLQRAPYTAATVLAATLLLKILDLIVKKIMSIHEDRLALAKLLVIARDTASAAASGLDVSDEDIFQERVRIKMELLKSYLSAGRVVSDVAKDRASSPGGDVNE